MKKGLLLSLLMLIMVGCNEFSTGLPKEKENKETKDVIPFFRTDDQDATGAVAHFISWENYPIITLYPSGIDTVSLSVIKVEGNTSYFKERVSRHVFCITSTDHIHDESCGNGTGRVIEENFFSFTAKNDTLFFAGESELFSCFMFAPFIPLRKPTTKLDKIDLMENLFPVAQVFNNSFGIADEVTLGGGNSYHNAIVLCDASPTYVDGPGHCLVFANNTLEATASFGLDMITGRPYHNRGYMRIK